MTTVFSNKALPPGTVLREWRLEQVLGVGGFGIVYKGRGIYFDELVAIKEYFPSAISDRKDGDTVVPTNSAAEEVHALGLKKFVEEAKLLWNLSKPTRHPNIVSVRSLFEIHGTAYMVMDFEDGLALSDLLKQGRRFSQESLFALLRPIAEGLDRAHRVGVLHRDIKPANILISEDGRPVLIDFGSARFDSGDATSTTVTFHTPPYAAIEQYVKTYAQGPWTDIYALGVALHECITGTKPPEVLERLHGGLGQALADQDIPGYSRAFLRAVDAAMVIRPGDRPQSIPQWLALFDLPDDAAWPAAGADEEATRFAAFQDLPEEIVPVAPALRALEPAATVAPPAAEPAPATARAAQERPAAAGSATAPRQGRPALIAGGMAVALLAGAGGYLALRPDRSPAPVATPDKQPAAPAAAGGAIDAAKLAGLPAAFDRLVAEARSAGRPAAELDRLSTAAEALKTQAAQLPGIKDPGQARAQAGRIADLAKTASAELANAIAADARQRGGALARKVAWADPGQPPALSGLTAAQRAAAGAVRRPFEAITGAAAAAATATDPAAAITAAETAVAASARLAPAIARMAAFSLTARNAELGNLASRARALAGEIAELAKAGKPGLFASREKRDSWKLRQDNARRAAAVLTELEQVAAAGGAATSHQALEAAIAKARRLQGELGAIKAASARAIQPSGQPAR